MTEESRAPLGELNAADYYGADCHAFSYAVIYDNDEEEEEEGENEGNAVPVAVAEKNAASAQPSRSTKLSSVSSISSILESTAPPRPESEAEPTKTSDAGIDIWDSESATEEAGAS